MPLREDCNETKDMRKRKQHIGIDIFSGAGGLSLGASMAGIKVKYAIEVNPHAAKSYEYNHKGSKVLCGDICKIRSKDFLKKSEKVFIIMGGPPCQGFSMANTMSRNMENPNNLLFKEFVRLVSEVEPEWFVLENVWGMTKMDDGQTIELIKHSFETINPIGYTVKWKILWADDYGVPQRRMRMFMVGNRLGINFEFPEPFSTKVTVEDAIGDLPVLKNGDMIDSLPYSKNYEGSSQYAQLMRKGSEESKQNFVSRNNELVIERYKHIGQGQNWRAIPEELMQNYADKTRCHSGIYKRLRADRPSVVITNYRKSMLIHPYQDRGLSVREAARLQSFPDTFIFQGPHWSIQQQIGNAVPPLLAKAVMDKILTYRTDSHE